MGITRLKFDDYCRDLGWTIEVSQTQDENGRTCYQAIAKNETTAPLEKVFVYVGSTVTGDPQKTAEDAIANVKQLLRERLYAGKFLKD